MNAKHYSEALVRKDKRIAEMEAELAERDELETLAQAFIDKLKVIHADPAYQAVWTLAHLHHGPYHGPQYADELRVLSACVETIRARAEEGLECLT